MAVTATNLSSQLTASRINSYAANAATTANVSDAKKTDDVDGGSVRAKAQTQLNGAIVQSSLKVAISSGNEPLALLYKSAVASLNETLKTDLGDNAIQNAAGQDNSAQSTAQRIVQLSTGFFDSYKQQHPGQDDATSLKQFMQTIKSGFEKGYKEATDILGGLKVFNGDIASNAQKTYELVQQGFADFEAAHGGTPGSGSAQGTVQ